MNIEFEPEKPADSIPIGRRALAAGERKSCVALGPPLNRRRQNYLKLHRLARLGSLGTVCFETSWNEYQWFLTQVYDLRFPHIGDGRHHMPRTFDPLARRIPIRKMKGYQL